jgi:hypothetical protein
MDVEGANLGFCLKEGPYHVVNLLVLFFSIFLGILSLFPKTYAKTWSAFPAETNTISSTKPRCFFRIGPALFIDGVGKLLRFPALLVISTKR